MSLNIDLQGKKFLKFLYIFAVIITLIMWASCSYINRKVGLEDDHILEEAVEELIDEVVENNLGIDPEIDLSYDASKN